MVTDRREFLRGAAASAAAGSLLRASFARADDAAPAAQPDAQPFSFDWLIDQARQRAAADYAPPSTKLPDEVANLSYDQYRDIRFKPETAIWADEAIPFRLDLFHLGFVYKDAVQIAVVADGKATDIPFSTDFFSYGKLVKPPKDISGLGFSGFRARFPINTPDVYDEFVVFQGASYFRAVARNQVYGLSARGLAVNTAEPQGEEFPAFEKFWIEKPSAESDSLKVYAMLDSPSLAGAYRFDITPGAETMMVVDAALFMRAEVKKMGIAPLTSMFLFNGMNRAAFDDYRVGVHDSGGLQALTGRGEWIWRPLSNPKTLQVSDFSDEHPRGFGLVQRARSFRDYEDAEARYQRRPSLWIEPIGNWGKGFVELVEIPTDKEINDNIVAYWRPDGAVPAGGPQRISYRMRWTEDVRPGADLLTVAESRAGLSFDKKRRLFVIDYAVADGMNIDPGDLAIDASASQGKLVNAVIHPMTPSGDLRISFEVDTGSADVSELRALLTRNGKPASETWLFRWTAD